MKNFLKTYKMSITNYNKSKVLDLKEEKKSLWNVLFEKFFKKSFKNVTLPIMQDIDIRINTLLNSNYNQNAFSKKFENQIKNYSAENKPITERTKLEKSPDDQAGSYAHMNIRMTSSTSLSFLGMACPSANTNTPLLLVG